MTACWSGWVVGGQPSRPFGPVEHGSPKFQYGPTAFHVWPPSSDSKTSSSPRNRCFVFAGSTARNWLYQAWTPGWYPLDAFSAEPELARLRHSATLFHGPLTSVAE